MIDLQNKYKALYNRFPLYRGMKTSKIDFKKFDVDSLLILQGNNIEHAADVAGQQIPKLDSTSLVN